MYPPHPTHKASSHWVEAMASTSEHTQVSQHSKTLTTWVDSQIEELHTPVVVLVPAATVVFVVVVVDVWGHCEHDAQNHWSQAACQPPPKEEHKVK